MLAAIIIESIRSILLQGIRTSEEPRVCLLTKFRHFGWGRVQPLLRSHLLFSELFETASAEKTLSDT